MSDNSISNLGNIKGEKGDKGEQGRQGLQGSKGADGRGIAKTELVNGELVITYTDGTSDNFSLGSDENQTKLNYYDFTLLDDGTYSVKPKAMYKDSLEVVSIPSEYNGIPVTQIAEQAFKDSKNLTIVKLPDTIKKINPGAFGGCTRLKMIELSENLEEIKLYAFSECTSLKNITIPKSVTTIGMFAFYESGLESAVFDDPLNWNRAIKYTSYGVEYVKNEESLGNKLSNANTAAEILKDNTKITYNTNNVTGQTAGYTLYKNK